VLSTVLFTKPKKAIGIDMGSHSVKAVQLSRIKGRLHVDEVGYAKVDREQVNVDPIAAHADAVRESIRLMQPSQALVVGALPGQTAVIRYPRLPEMPYNAIGEAVEAEAGQTIPYDLSEVLLDWSLLDTVAEGEQKMLRILLVAAKETVVTSRVQILDAAELQCGVLTVDSLALADAAEACDYLRVGESVGLINIGLTSASIHFTKDGVSNFIRDVNWGSRELIQSIAKNRHCEYDEAENALYEFSASQGAEGEPEAPEAPAEPEPASVEPELTTLESPLDPLEEELGNAATAPPRRGGLSGQGMRQQKSMREMLDMALSRLVSEVRRSFDYYEHQLYERPVDRLILSGGIAHLGIVGESLVEELGIARTEVADPGNSALLLGEGSELLVQQPAQYMVAVGLAARGMAEL